MKLQTYHFIACDKNYRDSNIVLFGAGYDSTCSNRSGSKFAPQAIRHESYALETYSPYQNKDLNDYQIFDSGDLELSIADSLLTLNQIKLHTQKILNDQKIPFMIGGEHLVTLGCIQAMIEKYPTLHIIHFDAHLDLRDHYLQNPYSHATVMRRCFDLVGCGRIHQFAIRSGDKEEFQFARSNTNLHLFDFTGLKELIAHLKIKQVPIYLSIDLDCLDLSVFSASGTLEAGGVSFMELLNAIITVCEGNVVGGDLCEYAPTLDFNQAGAACAAKVMREFILGLCK